MVLVVMVPIINNYFVQEQKPNKDSMAVGVGGVGSSPPPFPGLNFSWKTDVNNTTSAKKSSASQ